MSSEKAKEMLQRALQESGVAQDQTTTTLVWLNYNHNFHDLLRETQQHVRSSSLVLSQDFLPVNDESLKFTSKLQLYSLSKELRNCLQEIARKGIEADIDMREMRSLLKQKDEEIRHGV